MEQEVLDIAREDFTSERVSDVETVATIREVYRWPNTRDSNKGYLLDPHSAIGVTAALRSVEAAPGVHNVALATAHPAKFRSAVEMALKKEKAFQFKDVLPEQFIGLEDLPRNVIYVQKSGGLEGIRKLIVNEVGKELNRTHPDPCFFHTPYNGHEFEKHE